MASTFAVVLGYFTYKSVLAGYVLDSLIFGAIMVFDVIFVMTYYVLPAWYNRRGKSTFASDDS